MGNSCACLRTDSTTKEDGTYENQLNNGVSIEPLKEAPVSKLPSEPEEEDLEIDMNTRVEFQSAARGYFTRKAAGQKLQEFKGNQAEEEIQAKHESMKPENRFKRAKVNLPSIFKEFLKTEVLGSFDMSEPLDDGVTVEEKPALKLEDGTVYQGEWSENGRRHGRGMEQRKDGTRVSGYYKKGFLSGLGKAILPDGTIYQGMFEKGLPNGQGSYQEDSGAIIEAQFVNGLPNGQGTKTYPDGSVYKGEFKQGQRNGNGVMKWPNGDVYKGEFYKEHRHGNGKMTYHDNKSYDGQWKDGKITGKGIYKYKNGNVFEGEFVDAVKHGYGKLINSKGVIHECNWENGVEEGEGTITINTDSGTKVSTVVWENGTVVKKIKK